MSAGHIIVPKQREVELALRAGHDLTKLPATRDVGARSVSTRVSVRIDGAEVMNLSWQHADEFAGGLRLVSTQAARVGDSVVVLLDGRARAHLPWRTVAAWWAQVVRAARLAEEVEKAPQVAMDAAFLLRVGAPFGVTDDPAIRDAATTEAAWNSQLRRLIPGGVRGAVLFGTPNVVGLPPKKEAKP